MKNDSCNYTPASQYYKDKKKSNYILIITTTGTFAILTLHKYAKKSIG